MTKGWKKAEEPKKGRPWARLLLLCLLAATAAFLVWNNGYWDLLLGGGQPQESLLHARQGEATKASPVTERGRREAAYEKDLAALSGLTENQNVDSAIRQDAAKQLAQMIEEHQTELAIEDALSAAGYSPCMTLLQNGALTVLVETKELTATQSATILSLCAAHTHIGVENIRIMEGKR